MIRPAIAVFSLGLVAPIAKAAEFEVVPVLRSGTASPDGNGLFDRVVLSPTLNEAGTVTLSARLSGTNNGFLDDDVLLAVEPNGTLRVLGREGDLAPDFDGVYGSIFPSSPFLATFSQPAIGDAGAVTVARADFILGAQGATAGVTTGASAPLQIIAREGNPLANTGRVVTQLLVGFIAGNSAGQAAVIMDTSDSTGTIRRGIWRISATEALLILEVGEPSPDTIGQVLDFHEGWASINERGDVAFVAGLSPSGLSSDSDGAVVAFVDGLARVIAREGYPAVGGGTYGDFNLTAGNSRPVIDDGSRVTFRSPAPGGSSIFQWAPAGGMSRLLHMGQASPDGQGTLEAFLNPVVTANGTIGVLTVHSWQSGVGTDVGLLVGDHGGFEVAVRTGQPFPGGGAVVGNTLSMPHLNSSGTAAWVAGDSTATTYGLFMKRRGQPVIEIARSGGVLDGKVLDLPEVPPIPDPGNGKALNESDQLAFVAWFQDGTQGIYMARPCADTSLGLPCVALDADTHAISVATGGTDALTLDAGVSRAGRAYLILSSASGTWPGQAVSSNVTLPLNPDPWFLLTIANPNSGLLPGSFGLLDAQGKATAAFHLPPTSLPSLAGTLIHQAFVVANAAGNAIEVASNPSPLTLVP